MTVLSSTKCSLIFLYLVCALVFTVQLAEAQDLEQPRNSNLIDLSQKDWGQGKQFSLQGTWLFSWNTFTHNTLIHDKPQGHQATWHEAPVWHEVTVPGPWNENPNQQSTNESSISPLGFGTYYQKILVPQNIHKVFMHLPDMASAYELWHNGEKLGGNGTIGINKTQEQAHYLPRVYELRPKNGEIELFIKTSNHHYLWGGIWYAPTITDESGVHKIRELPVLRAMSSGTVLLATSVLCLFMFLSRKQYKKLLYFSLFCLAIGIRRLCIDERVLYLTGLFDWQTLQSMENITLYLMLPLFLNYFQLTFPQTTSNKLPAVGWICALPFCLAALALEVETYTGFNPYFQILVLMFLPFVLFSWGRAFLTKLEYSKMFGFSLAIFIATVINDILNYSYIIQTTNLTHVGVLAFVLFQLVILMRRYLSNFLAIESLSETLKEKNRALVQHDEFKDDFLANTSHELRMPLHGMAGLAKTVRQAAPELSADATNKIRLIEATAVRLGNLVNDILDMSSLKHGKLNIQTHPAYLEPLIESTVLSLGPLIKNKPVALEYSVEENARVVLADEQRLQQILFNLIGNAIKFTKEGSIKVEAGLQEGQVVVSVNDTGIGMSSEQLATVLQAYETHNYQSGSELRGSGLGLSITKMLVELHGGTLNIESKEGLGTTVSFSLQSSNETPHTPVENHDLQVEEAPEIAPTPGFTANNTLTENALIFFADDEEVNRELVSSQLLAAGYRIEIFPDGQTLLNRLNEEVPELVLLDWVMPEKDGLVTCESIREHYDASDLPVIMLTAKHQIHDIVKAFNAGANDYLTKPYHEQELVARVSSQISVKRLLVATIENESLKAEVARQERQKAQLNIANQRLVTTLDSSQENIVLLSEDLDMIYANAGARALLDISASDFDTEAAFPAFLSDDSIRLLSHYVNSGQSGQPLVLRMKNKASELYTTINTVDIDQEHFLSLILTDEPADTDQNTQSLLSSLTQEIAENRQRMEQIESTLRQLNGSKQGDVVIPKVHSPELQSALDPKELVVKTLRAALISWERYTDKTKAELAEESHCWRVYLDGATAKTRTLDKYLSVKTLPAKPRWRAVIKTANYVLDHCELGSEDDAQLRDLVQQLTEAFS